MKKILGETYILELLHNTLLIPVIVTRVSFVEAQPADGEEREGVVQRHNRHGRDG